MSCMIEVAVIPMLVAACIKIDLWYRGKAREYQVHQLQS